MNCGKKKKKIREGLNKAESQHVTAEPPCHSFKSKVENDNKDGIKLVL